RRPVPANAAPRAHRAAPGAPGGAGTIRRYSCCGPLGRLLRWTGVRRLCRVPGQCKEHLVQARLAEREITHVDARLTERGKCGRSAHAVLELHTQRTRVCLGVRTHAEPASQQVPRTL